MIGDNQQPSTVIKYKQSEKDRIRRIKKKVMTVLMKTEGERLALLGPTWVPKFESIASLFPTGKAIKI